MFPNEAGCLCALGCGTRLRRRWSSKLRARFYNCDLHPPTSGSDGILVASIFGSNEGEIIREPTHFVFASYF